MNIICLSILKLCFIKHYFTLITVIFLIIVSINFKTSYTYWRYYNLKSKSICNNINVNHFFKFSRLSFNSFAKMYVFSFVFGCLLVVDPQVVAIDRSLTVGAPCVLFVVWFQCVNVAWAAVWVFVAGVRIVAQFLPAHHPFFSQCWRLLICNYRFYEF